MREKVLITGASSGIGLAAVTKFLDEGFIVIGIDIVPSRVKSKNYIHYIADVSDRDSLPDIEDVEILINSAGIQTECTDVDYTSHDIDVNLRGTINTTVKYGLKNPRIMSIVNLASVSAHNGAEFPEYVASKGGVLSYTIWTAKQLAKKRVTVNSLSFGGVLTDLNRCIIDDIKLWDKVMDETPMKKWINASEAADWIYFLSVVNKSCTGQDFIVDNGEMINHNFIWR